MRPSEASEFDRELLKDVVVSRDFRLGHPELVKRVKELIAAYKRMFPRRDIIATCVYRAPEEQQRLFKQGRFGNPGAVITNCDGFTKISNHNKYPSRAVDLAITEGGKCVWDESLFWPLGALAKECGLVWGGDWNGNGIKDERFPDPPHVELGRDVS